MKIDGKRIAQTRAYLSAKNRADKLIKNPEGLFSLIEKASKKAQTNLSERYHEFKTSLNTCFRLLKAYAKGEYREIPWKSLSLIIASVIYFLTPVDFIPDFLATFGFIDDAALLTWTLNAIKVDLDAYLVWEQHKSRESVEKS